MNLSTPGPSAETPRVAVDAEGDSFAVWGREGCCGSFVEVAERPAGSAWERGIDLSEATGGGATEPEIATDASGDGVAVWREDGVIQSARKAAGGEWQAAANLSEPGHAAWKPQVAMYPDGRALVVWQLSDGDSEVIQGTTSSTEQTWQQPVDLSEPDADSARIAVDSHGDALVIWNRLTAGSRNIETAALPDQGSWQAPETVSQGTEGSEIPDISMDAAGDAMAVWEHHTGSNELIQSAFRPANGTWQQPLNLTPPAANALEPHVGMDETGDAIGVWETSMGTHELVQSAFRPAGGTWSAVENVSPSTTSSFREQLAVNAKGDAVATWWRAAGEELIFAATKMAGGAWRKPVALSEQGTGFLPAVAIDPHGNSVGVWQHRISGTQWAIQAAGFDDAGPLPNALVIPATGLVGQPKSFLVSPLDVWSALGATTWKFGDGAAARGLSVRHAYKTPGAYTVTVTTSDVLGNRASASSAIMISAASGATGSARSAKGKEARH